MERIKIEKTTDAWCRKVVGVAIILKNVPQQIKSIYTKYLCASYCLNVGLSKGSEKLFFSVHARCIL